MKNSIRQGGAALVVGLLLLVVALVFSLSSMQTAMFEETMTGNYRAGERALMAAEYGASEIFHEIYNEDLDEYDLSVITDGGISFGQEHFVEEGVFYKVIAEVDSGADETFSLNLVSVGFVVSGSNSNGQNRKIVAQREVLFKIAIPTFDELGALNQSCAEGFQVPAVPSGIDAEYEIVDGQPKYKPAIAVGSRDEAEIVIKGIFSQGSNKDIVFPSGSDEAVTTKGDVVAKRIGNVWHASPAVSSDDAVLYDDGCKVTSNRMCAYVGGVSEEHPAKILDNPARFHYFIESIFNNVTDGDGGELVYFHDISSDGRDFVSGAINVYTDRSFNVVSSPDDFPFVFKENSVEVKDDDGTVVQVFDVADDVAKHAADGWDVSTPYSSDDVPLAFALTYLGDENLVSGENSTYFPTMQNYGFSYPGDVYYGDESSGFYNYDVSQGFSNYLLSEDGSPLVRGDIYSPVGAYYGLERPEFEDNNYFNISDGVKDGILIVDGNALFKGQPRFDGLILVLGDLSIGGGGSAEKAEFYGSVITSPYFYNTQDGVLDFICQPSEVDTSGGGNHKIIYDPETLQNAFKLLPPEAMAAWLIGNYGGDEDPIQLDAWVERAENKVVLN